MIQIKDNNFFQSYTVKFIIFLEDKYAEENSQHQVLTWRLTLTNIIKILKEILNIQVLTWKVTLTNIIKILKEVIIFC